MTAVDVFVPVLARPHRVEPLLESLTATEPDGFTVRPVFICSPSDRDELAAVRAAGVDPLVATWEPAGGDYARKMNLAWRLTDAEWAFLAADDLVFRTGWLEAAIRCSERNGNACVIGTNDLGNRRVMAGRHSTHTLVHTEYRSCGTIDQPSSGKLLTEKYDHNFCDDEFVQTAQARATFASAKDSIVEHLHPDWGKADHDAVYAKGRRHFQKDARLHQQRSRMWTGRRG